MTIAKYSTTILASNKSIFTSLTLQTKLMRKQGDAIFFYIRIDERVLFSGELKCFGLKHIHTPITVEVLMGKQRNNPRLTDCCQMFGSVGVAGYNVHSCFLASFFLSNISQGEVIQISYDE